MDKVNVIRLNTLSRLSDGLDLNDESKLYLRALDRMVMSEVSNYEDGLIDYDRIYKTLEVLAYVVDSTQDELAYSMLKELYDRAVRVAGLE